LIEKLAQGFFMKEFCFARADSMTPPEAEEIWNSFEATIQRIETQLQNSEYIFI
jgi:hypothetical protein